MHARRSGVSVKAGVDPYCSGSAAALHRLLLLLFGQGAKGSWARVGTVRGRRILGFGSFGGCVGGTVGARTLHLSCVLSLAYAEERGGTTTVCS